MLSAISMKCVSLVILAIISSCINLNDAITERLVMNAKQYFRRKMLSSETPASTSMNITEFKPYIPVESFDSRFFLGVLHGKYKNLAQRMAHCEKKEDCDAGIRMICSNKKCDCRLGELFFEWPKYGCFVKAPMFAQCEVSGQCLAMNPNTYCNPENGRCTCSPNYFFNGHECSLRYDGSNLKAQEVYKAAVVAAACFIVAVVGIFVACIVRRSFCRREQQLQQSESNRNSDIFSISDEIAALRAVDKPPSYEEVLQIERTFYGIPPPEYSGPRNEILSAELLSTASALHESDRLNPEFQSTSVSVGNRCSSLAEHPKESTADSTVGENLSENSQSEIASTSDFIAAAEILPVPSCQESTNQNLPSIFETSSHSARVSHPFSTPPPRFHRSSIKSEQGSSSLPNSPYISTISSSATASAVDIHTESGNELLQNSTTTAEVISHSLQGSYLSHSEDPCNMAISHEIDTNRNASDFSHSVTVIAYDNLGFESDLYL